jgi:hypothetical protein
VVGVGFGLQGDRVLIRVSRFRPSRFRAMPAAWCASPDAYCGTKICQVARLHNRGGRSPAILTRLPDYYRYVPNQDAASRSTARDALSHLGRLSSRGRTQAHAGTADDAASPATRPRVAVSGACDAAWGTRAPVVPRWRTVRRGAGGVGARVHDDLSCPALLRTSRSSASRGGGRVFHEPFPRHPGPRHPRGQGHQPGVAPPRQGDRFHAHPLRTPREVRNALVYVLNNFRKHIPGARRIDSRSSSAWFSGWKVRMGPTPGPSPVAAPRTWLARVGWLRGGRIHLDESPRGTPRSQTATARAHRH